MQRRDWMKWAAGGLGLAAVSGEVAGAKPETNKLPKPQIRDVRAILTQPAGIRLAVVKVETNEPELYGLGCATFTQRARVVKTAVNQCLKPFLTGKNPLEIEDIWQSSFVSSYWRNGPVLGDNIELLHDIHERVPPILAIQMAKDLEPYRLFFLEDPFSPEDVGYFEHLRRQTSTPSDASTSVPNA